MENNESVTEQEFTERLGDLLFENEELGVSTTRTFDEAGVLTSNQGLVVTLENGDQFQLTVVRSR